MRGPLVRVVTLLLASVVAGCAPAPSPSPAITQPPIPPGFVPWPNIVWGLANLPQRPAEVTDERVEAVTATAAAIVAVGFREIGGVRDGIVWHSADGETWKVADDVVFEGVDLVDVAPAPDGAFMAFGVELKTEDEEHPTAVAFRSADGASWDRLPPLPATGDTYPTSITGGSNGVVAVGADTGGAVVVWRTADGRSFQRVNLSGPAAGGLLDPEPAGDGFVALAEEAESSTVLRSADGSTWQPSPVDPASNADLASIAVGRWGLVVQGSITTECAETCAAKYAAWWSMDGERWGRLPADSPLTNGVSLAVAAGDHGLLAIDGADAWSSPDGWAWRSLPDPGDGSVAIDDAVVRGDEIVAVGAEVADDGSSLGRILVAR